MSGISELILRHGYADNMLSPGVLDLDANSRSDVQLAFAAFYPLLKYETDLRLLEIYKKS